MLVLNAIIFYQIEKIMTQSSQNIAQGDLKDLESILGHSERIKKVIDLIRLVAGGEVTVLVTGESGTGKELVARVLHNLSARRAGPFLPVDCASIPETLIESELFGSEKGAYTGAGETRPGKLELADGGTLFLDEVTNISLGIQAKLLRYLEWREFERVGGRKAIKTDVRVIAACNADLKELVAKGSLRLDLFYRLNEFPIHLPPLRKRKEDLPFLCQRLLEELEGEVGKKISRISPAAMAKIQHHDFPGNVRELRNLLMRAMLVAKDRIEAEDLLHEVWSMEDIRIPDPEVTSLKEEAHRISEQVEREKILEALEKTSWHQGRSAELLQITRKTLYNKMKIYRLHRE